MKETNERKDFNLECGCGHGFIQMSYRPEDKYNPYAIYLLGYYEAVFYTKQNGIFKTIRDRIALAFSILVGKEYNLYELSLDAKQFEDFVNHVNQNAKEDQIGMNVEKA